MNGFFMIPDSLNSIPKLLENQYLSNLIIIDKLLTDLLTKFFNFVSYEI